MAGTSKTIKCTACGVYTTDADYCKNCGDLISYSKKQELKAKKLNEEFIEAVRFKMENPNKIERMKKHPLWIVKFFGYLLNSVIFVVSVIGSALAWFIAMVAAG